MPLSDSGLKDLSMLGSSGYARNPLDFYPTPDSAIDSLLAVIEDDLPSFKVWEPCCGDGAISKRLAPLALDLVSTDIKAYEGFDPDGTIDFLSICPKDAIPVGDQVDWEIATALMGFEPDCIITNPPYGDDAEAFARHALRLMESQMGIVMFLCRHEWDCAKGRSDLFDHPAFAMKITLRHRPRWIKGSKGAPRHNYSWYVWNWLKPVTAKSELVYVR